MENILILGNGGHAESVIDTIETEGIYKVKGYIVNDDRINKNLDYPIIGNDDDLKKLFENGIKNAAVGIGYLGRGKVREILYEHLKKIGYQLPIIKDPTSIISKKVKVDEGVFIGKGVIINTNSYIEKMCIINTGAIIEHDNKIGEFTHIAVGAVLCGNVTIGEGSFVGANAVIIQGITIGKNCFIPAGSIVKKDMKDGEWYR